MKEQRKERRVPLAIGIKISVGTQLTIEGQIKDLSVSSAFILIKNSVFLDIHDQVGFKFEHIVDGISLEIEGAAIITRFVKGEGFAIAFNRLNPEYVAGLNKIISSRQ